MTAAVTFTMGDSGYLFTKELWLGTNPSEKWPGIKANKIESIELSGPELEHAISFLGAPNVRRPRVVYFGDEARRIFFNW